MIEETQEVEKEEEMVRKVVAELKKEEDELIQEMDQMKREHTKDLQALLEKEKDIVDAAKKFYSDLKQSMKTVGDMNETLLQELNNIHLQQCFSARTNKSNKDFILLEEQAQLQATHIT